MKKYVCCVICGVSFEKRNGLNLYCGSRKNKTGCAYSVFLSKRKIWEEVNKEKREEYRKQYQIINHEKILLKARKYASDNKEIISKRLKERYKDGNNYYLLKNYGITKIEYNEMRKSQNYKCKICGRDEKDNSMSKYGKVRNLLVDHCHVGGNVRGLLCHNCNTLLGMCNDNIEILKESIKYLIKNNKNYEKLLRDGNL